MKINKKVLGLVLAGMLSVGVVGCGNNDVEEQPQVQQEERIQDEDLNREYLENRTVQTDLEEAKVLVENWLIENELDNSFVVVIDEQNNRLYIVGVANSEYVADCINRGEWDVYIDFGKMATSEFHKQLGVDVAFVIVTSDAEKCYLSVFNGEVMFDVEEELINQKYGLNN